MKHSNNPLESLGLKATNAGAWSGSHGWSSDTTGPLIDSINPATGQRLAQVRGAELRARAELYRTLGGGWQP